MHIKCAPILYGRTFKMDFASRLLVEPAFFSVEDTKTSFELIKSSMDGFDFAGENGRIVVFSNDRYVVTGLSIEFRYLFTACKQEPLYHRLDSATGREAYGFIGLVIPYNEFPKVPVKVSYPELMRVYCDCIKPLWKNEYKDFINGERPTTKAGLIEADFDEMLPADTYVIENTIESALHIESRVVTLKSDTFDREILASAIMKLATRQEISFCSDVDDISIHEVKKFKVVTSSEPNNLAQQVEIATENETFAPHNDDSFRSSDTNYEKVNHSNWQIKASKDNRYAREVTSNERVVKSYDDVLEALNTDENNGARKVVLKKKDSIDFDMQRRINSLGETKTNERLTILGITAGIVYVVVGLFTDANPIVLAIVGATTIILCGIEAKRIIERYRS